MSRINSFVKSLLWVNFVIFEVSKHKSKSKQHKRGGNGEGSEWNYFFKYSNSALESFKSD